MTEIDPALWTALAHNDSLALVYNPWDVRRVLTGESEGYWIQGKTCGLIPKLVLKGPVKLGLMVVLTGDKERDRGLMAEADAKVRRIELGARGTLTPEEIQSLPDDEVSDGRGFE